MADGAANAGSRLPSCRPVGPGLSFESALIPGEQDDAEEQDSDRDRIRARRAACLLGLALLLVFLEEGIAVVGHHLRDGTARRTAPAVLRSAAGVPRTAAARGTRAGAQRPSRAAPERRQLGPRARDAQGSALLRPHQRSGQRDHHSQQRGREADDGHRAKVAQHREVADEQHGEACDRGDSARQDRGARARVGARQRRNRLQPASALRPGSGPRGSPQTPPRSRSPALRASADRGLSGICNANTSRNDQPVASAIGISGTAAAASRR